MLTETHRARCSLVKHHASRHVLWKRRADATAVGLENGQATVPLMTIATLEKHPKGCCSWLWEETASHGRGERALGGSQGGAVSSTPSPKSRAQPESRDSGNYGQALEEAEFKAWKMLDKILGDFCKAIST